ncbi:MAG: DUF2892 domain-containing protein [Methylococcaceae bacterium]|nr:DUF2892 domain-containing protein [Methylococcaceae bacterium]
MNFDFKKMLKRELNIGEKERKLRFVAGSVVLLISVFLGNIPLLLIGSLLVVTGFMRWCPAYSGLGRSSVDPNDPAPKSCCGHH